MGLVMLEFFFLMGFLIAFLLFFSCFLVCFFSFLFFFFEVRLVGGVG